MNRQILRLSIPNIITNITVPLLGLVDMAMMGHLGNPVYIGAVALGATVFNIIYSSFAFLRMGTSGFTAQAFGAKKNIDITLVLYRSLLVALLLSLFLVSLQFPIQWLAFQLLDGSNEVKELAKEYFFIRIFAAPATLGLYALYGWFLGIQNARIPMIIAITVNVVNIGLNFLFIYYLKMNSNGVALSSVVAQYTGLFLAVFFLLKKYSSFLQKIKLALVLQAEELKRFFKVNSDIFIRTILLLLVLAFFTSRSALIGDNILAVNSLLFQFFFIFSYFADGFAYAGEALTGKVKGAGDTKELRKTIKYLFYWGWGASILFLFVFALGLQPLMRLMTDNQQLISISQDYRLWVLLLPITSGAAFIWDGIYIGVTASKAMRNAMIIASLVVFLPSYFITYKLIGNHSLWLALNLFMLCRGLLMWAMAKNAVYK